MRQNAAIGVESMRVATRGADFMVAFMVLCRRGCRVSKASNAIGIGIGCRVGDARMIVVDKRIFPKEARSVAKYRQKLLTITRP